MEQKYKVGDIVTVKAKREYPSDKYRFCFTDEMVEKHGGKSYEISYAVQVSASKDSTRLPDDGYRYNLKDCYFFWASSMFEETPVPTKASPLYDDIGNGGIDAFIRRKKNPELDFSL